LGALGLVSGALWSDVDADGDPDLVVATDWGPPRLLRNDGGRLIDATDTAGLAGFTGRWNGLGSGDVDHDADIDLVATNLGLNTPYRATDDQPLVAFAGRIDDDDNVDYVETVWEGGVLYPRRNRGELMRDLPGIASRFDSFATFSHATIQAVLGDAGLSRATRLEVRHLEHALFENDGRGHFTAQPLPAAAQLMVGFGVVVDDLDDDGHDDVALVGNFTPGEPVHTGPLDGGVGVVLRGDGAGAFEAVPVAESGLSVSADGRGLAAADYDHDGWIDLAAGVNNGRLRLLHNHGVPGRAGLTVRLEGNEANPTAVGARVTLERQDGLVITREVQAGSSFLSQSSASLVFGLGSSRAGRLTVRWPDGATQVVDPGPGPYLVIRKG
jgi:hypothetical protein